MTDTRWVQAGDGAHIAYQLAGDGPDILLQPDWLTNLELDSTYWRPRDFNERLSHVGRVIRIDPRGAGLSDGVLPDALPTAEEIADDTVAVLDAVGASDVVLVASGEGGLLAMTFAATHPHRVRGLVLVNAFARFTAAPDYPIGWPREAVEAALVEARDQWGTGYSAEFWNPDMAADPEYVEWLARWQRTVAGPSVAFALFRLTYLDLDARATLETITAPTLVLHREQCRAIPVGHGEFIAGHIANAQLRLLPGVDGLIWGGGADDVVAEISEFVTGVRPVTDPDRVLATILFTDLVESTTKARQLGDAEWRRLLDRHDAIARTEVQRHRGQLIKSTGDGILATFDGPARAVRCAGALRQRLLAHGLHVRAGVHTGEIEVRGDDIGGIAVHIASRVQSVARPDEVLVSRTVTDLVAGAGLSFEDRGSHVLKGVDGSWPLFLATNA